MAQHQQAMCQQSQPFLRKEDAPYIRACPGIDHEERNTLCLPTSKLLERHVAGCRRVVQPRPGVALDQDRLLLCLHANAPVPLGEPSTQDPTSNSPILGMHVA
jgi:hypothetical protein